MEDKNGEEIVEQIHFCFDTIYPGTTIKDDSESNVPTGILEAFNEKKSNTWMPSAASKVMQFLSRNCWNKVLCSLVPQSLDMQIMNIMWAFQVNNKHDGLLHHKSRVCSKGYKQIPSIDFTESFAPVATDMTVTMTLCIYLYYTHGRDGMISVCEIIDILAAFLEGDMESLIFIDWPAGLVCWEWDLLLRMI
jgi:hypothetical protein